MQDLIVSPPLLDALSREAYALLEPGDQPHGAARAVVWRAVDEGRLPCWERAEEEGVVHTLVGWMEILGREGRG